MRSCRMRRVFNILASATLNIAWTLVRRQVTEEPVRRDLSLERLADFFPIGHLFLQFCLGRRQFLRQALRFLDAYESLQSGLMLGNGLFQAPDLLLQFSKTILHLLALDRVQAFGLCILDWRLMISILRLRRARGYCDCTLEFLRSTLLPPGIV